jgi:predicted house-cleaning noncanonical NTP pyrophosphatase (MazG superfamily)
VKLVRDRIGDIPWPNEEDKQYLRPVKDCREHLALLEAKIQDELDELMSAVTDEGRIEEAGDVIEAIYAYLRLVNKDPAVVSKMFQEKLKKKQERGGFDEGTVYDPPRPRRTRRAAA